MIKVVNWYGSWRVVIAHLGRELKAENREEAFEMANNLKYNYNIKTDIRLLIYLEPWQIKTMAN